MANKLHVGLSKEIELPRNGGFLYISDEVPKVKLWSRVFDPLKDCFNPLKDISYKTARQIAEILYTISPQGENTLTVRNGKRAMLKALLTTERRPRFDRIHGDEEVNGMVGDILASPVLRRILCNARDQFSFNPRSNIFARVNRIELGEFDALVLGLFLLSRFTGQIIVDAFYLRPAHISLLREQRLIACCTSLSEIPANLRDFFLLGKVIPQGVVYDDAVLLAKQARLTPGTNDFLDFVQSAVS